MVVGMAAAIMQGVPGTTQDIDLWFDKYTSPEVLEAFRSVGATLVWRASPPVVSGPEAFDLVDVVRSCSGLGTFREEYEKVVKLVHDETGVVVPVMSARRVAVSKRAAGRPKNRLAVTVIEDSLKAMASREK